MKKIIVTLLIATGVVGCANVSTKYNPTQFTTDNYQQNVARAIEYADNFVDFDQESAAQASLATQDLSILINADVSYNQGSYSQAADSYYYLANKYKDPRIVYKAIVCYEHSVGTPTNLAKLQDMTKLLLLTAPNSKTAHLFSIREAISQNNLAQAKSDLKTVINADPSRTRSILLFLTTSISNSVDVKSPASLNEFAQYIVRKYADYPEAYLFASVAYSVANNQEQLLATLDKIHTDYPNWEVPTYWSAGVLSKLNNDKLLNAMVKHQVSASGKPSETLQNLYIAVLLRGDKLNDANNFVDSNLQLSPNDANLTVSKAIIQYRQGNNPAALNSLLKVESTGFTLDGSVDLAIASLYDIAGNAESATPYYQKAGVANPALADATKIAIIKNYFDLNKTQQVNEYIASLAKAAKMSPRDSELLQISAYAEAEHYEQAYQLVSKAIKQYRNDKDFSYYYASLSGLTGRTNQAINLYQKYIKKYPQDSGGYNDLGFILADKTTRYTQAYNYAQKAYKIAPNDAAVLDTIGWANFKLKQYSQAESYVNLAYQQTQDAETAQHLKQIYLAQGKTAQANQVIIVPAKLQRLKFEQTLVDQAMLILMYYQFGLDINK